MERNALGEEFRLPADLRKHCLPRSFVSKARDRDLRALFYFGADREEAGGRAGIGAERRGWEIVDQEWYGFVPSARIEHPVCRETTTPRCSNRHVRAGDHPFQTNAGHAVCRKCVVYRAGSRAVAKQRAAADSDLHHWVILEAHWRPAPDNQGGALILRVEEPES